jgi:hypothetical protein
MQTHPIADLFPMMSDDDLASLAADIKANGQSEPIMLDAAGELLIDGRNRLKACGIAGVEPKFARANGEDQTAFILSRNMARRHMTKGQLAIVAAKMSPKPARVGRGQKVSISETFPMVHPGMLSQARVMVEYAPLAADRVLTGIERFSDAFADAQKMKAERADAAEKKAKLADRPDLIKEVAEERMTLDEALANGCHWPKSNK